MPSVTLYDGQTGAPVSGDGPARQPLVSADDHAGVTFALDPGAGRALVQFVVDPGSKRLVATLDLADDDDLPALYRAVQERVAESTYHIAPPGRGEPHLNVFHYLAAPDAASPEASIRGHLVSADEPLEVVVPTAAEAASVLAFFRERAPWKAVAVHGVGTTVSDADVDIAVDPAATSVSYPGREESWVDEDAASAQQEVNVAHETPAPEDAVGTDRIPAGLRIYDADTGELEYAATTDPPTDADEIRRYRAEGIGLHADPAADVLRAVLTASKAGTERAFVAEYENADPDTDLLTSFAAELSSRVDQLGVEFDVLVGEDALSYAHLTDVAPDQPAPLTGGDLASLSRTGGPVEFAAPSGESAFELARFLAAHLEGQRSYAVSESGRTGALEGTDVVVTADPDCEGIEPRGATAAALADRRLQEQVTDLGGAMDAMSGRIREITGTIGAHQRVFAAALRGGALASEGLTVVPVDDDPVARRRRQARYLVLYGLVLAGLVAGVRLGELSVPTALLADTHGLQFGPYPGTPLSASQYSTTVEGRAAVGGSAAALLVGLYLLFGYPAGPLSALGSLLSTLRRQVTGGVGSGTVPNTVRELSDPVQASLTELRAAHAELADSEGTTAGTTPEFGAFVHQHLLARPRLPDVALVSRRRRWLQLLVAVVRGAVVGAVAAAVVLVGVRAGLSLAVRAPALALKGLFGVVALLALAVVLRLLVLRYADGRLPGWPTAR